MSKCMPRLAVVIFVSTARTYLFKEDKATAKFAVVVVFPEPPFGEITANTLTFSGKMFIHLSSLP